MKVIKYIEVIIINSKLLLMFFNESSFFIEYKNMYLHINDKNQLIFG